jgi:hypothetical protein
MKRFWLTLPAVSAIAAGAFLFSERSESAPGKPNDNPNQELKNSVSLPISQVILFNSGVGHFTRSGQVEGDARVDLTFPEHDINDLIKSMTLRDLSPNGRVSAVNYDSHDPIDRTLQSFAINLNGQQSFGSILQQARGEAIEVALVNTANQPGTLTGKIISIEKQRTPAKEGPPIETEILNMWCAEGMRSVKLNEIQRLRFSNPVIENEMRRALETLALSHDAQKKAVSLFFAGEGKRKVEVGYVIENPIWKTSYRLVLNKEGKPYLQGWAVVENPTDEDWGNVAVALVSGRPISFKMDLYNPLYVARPTVEPELFASLRPPTYGGTLGKVSSGMANRPGQPMGAMGGFGGGGGMGMPGGMPGTSGGAPGMPEPKFDAQLSFEQPLINSPQEKALYAKEIARKLQAGLQLGASVQSVATASALGDYFQYVIDQPVNLARQKSALLPIVNKEVEGKRVSIYNPNVQAKHPLLGLKFKNTAGMPLAQGPITVFEGSTYAGDTRVLDLQQDEERLISYAVDLGTEVAMKPGNSTSQITKVKAVKGIVYMTNLIREERIFDIANRSATDRVLLIEHPNRKGEGYKFVGTNKPGEEAADVYRFEVKIPSKKDQTYSIVEEKELGTQVQLTNNADNNIRHFLSMKEVPDALKLKLQEAMRMKGAWDMVRQEIATSIQRIQTITTDQKRIRDNLRETPKESPLFAKYLKTLEDQEKEMDDLQAKLKKLHGDEATTRTNFDTYLANLSAE